MEEMSAGQYVSRTNDVDDLDLMDIDHPVATPDHGTNKACDSDTESDDKRNFGTSNTDDMEEFDMMDIDVPASAPDHGVNQSRDHEAEIDNKRNFRAYVDTSIWEPEGSAKKKLKAKEAGMIRDHKRDRAECEFMDAWGSQNFTVDAEAVTPSPSKKMRMMGEPENGHADESWGEWTDDDTARSASPIEERIIVGIAESSLAPFERLSAKQIGKMPVEKVEALMRLTVEEVSTHQANDDWDNSARDDDGWGNDQMPSSSSQPDFERPSANQVGKMPADKADAFMRLVSEQVDNYQSNTEWDKPAGHIDGWGNDKVPSSSSSHHWQELRLEEQDEMDYEYENEVLLSKDVDGGSPTLNFSREVVADWPEILPSNGVQDDKGGNEVPVLISKPGSWGPNDTERGSSSYDSWGPRETKRELSNCESLTPKETEKESHSYDSWLSNESKEEPISSGYWGPQAVENQSSRSGFWETERELSNYESLTPKETEKESHSYDSWLSNESKEEPISSGYWGPQAAENQSSRSGFWDSRETDKQSRSPDVWFSGEFKEEPSSSRYWGSQETEKQQDSSHVWGPQETTGESSNYGTWLPKETEKQPGISHVWGSQETTGESGNYDTWGPKETTGELSSYDTWGPKETTGESSSYDTWGPKETTGESSTSDAWGDCPTKALGTSDTWDACPTKSSSSLLSSLRIEVSERTALTSIAVSASSDSGAAWESGSGETHTLPLPPSTPKADRNHKSGRSKAHSTASHQQRSSTPEYGSNTWDEWDSQPALATPKKDAAKGAKTRAAPSTDVSSSDSPHLPAGVCHGAMELCEADYIPSFTWDMSSPDFALFLRNHLVGFLLELNEEESQFYSATHSESLDWYWELFMTSDCVRFWSGGWELSVDRDIAMLDAWEVDGEI